MGLFDTIGKGLGAIGGGISNIFGGSQGLGGSPDKFSRTRTMTRPQTNFLNQLYQGGGLESSPLYQQGSNYLSDLLSGSPENYANFEAPYMQNFQQNIIPQIAERFAGMGTGAGASSSSALYNALAQAGRGLQTDLAGLRSGLQNQSASQGLQYAQLPFSQRLAGLSAQPYQTTYQPGQPGLFTNVLSGLLGGVSGGFGQGFGQAGADYFGNRFFGGQ